MNQRAQNIEIHSSTHLFAHYGYVAQMNIYIIPTCSSFVTQSWKLHFIIIVITAG